jgi:hypothetical protein
VSRDPRFPQRPLNGCSGCGTDFASVSAFDRHRVGKFEPLERRCMDETEMVAAGLELDPRGRWRIAADAERIRQAHQGDTSAVRLTPERAREDSEGAEAA